MAKKTLSEQIFEMAREKGLVPHSIINNCCLIIKNGNTISGKSKPDILRILKNI